MKTSFPKLVSALAVAAGLSFASIAQAVTFNYASIESATIAFNGASQFTFGPASNNFQVTSGSANGLLGEVTGTYTIGAVTTVGPTSSAPVSGVGSFVIRDGAFTLTGVLSWMDIAQTGTGGGVNTVGAVNLTGLNYGGFNADLLALKNAGNAYNVLTFQFVPAVSLATLKTTVNSTSFSGTVLSATTPTVPDGGPTVVLLALAMSGVVLARRKFSV